MFTSVNHMQSVKGAAISGLFTRRGMVAGWPEHSTNPVSYQPLNKRDVTGATSEEVSRG